MKYVAKLVVIDDNGNYLLLYRDNHPIFGNDPDLPGGTLEEGETMHQTMVREVQEEAGISIEQEIVEELYTGMDYSGAGTHYALYRVKLTHRPDVVISWEHARYEWIDRNKFLYYAKHANDGYMQMVHDVIVRHP
jgi:mutator protein MutT